MIDALNLGGPAELELIYIDDPRELAYWAQVLDVPDDELRKIVNRVGPRAIDVRRHLARVRHAERQRKAHQSQNHVQVAHAQEPRGDLGFVLLVCCAAAAATAFGALAYSMTPSDEWTASRRQHGCEAASGSDPAFEQLRCPDGRTIVRAKLANAADDSARRPLR
jgi:hypothetical protein